MHLKLFWSTFVLIFVAEMGDKTQLATLSLAAGTRSRLSVFAGAATGLALTSAIAVLGGDVVARWIPLHWIRKAAGLLFLALGSVYLFGTS
jgi:Ca2+/H+ antiporter, TMEM165/GDT1 family